MPELTSRRANVPPKQVPSQHSFAAALSLHPGLCAAQDVCDWFKDMQARQGVLSLSPMLRGLAMQDYVKTDQNSLGLSFHCSNNH